VDITCGSECGSNRSKNVDQTCDQLQKCGSFKNVDLSQIENVGGLHAVSYTGLYSLPVEKRLTI
jgi:hypothetical protein